MSPDGKLIASACKSTTVQHATIRLFSTETWLEIKPPLSFDSLTVTRLRFSQDNSILLPYLEIENGVYGNVAHKRKFLVKVQE